MNEQKARELAADVIKLHRPDHPKVTSELAPSEPQAQSARCSVAHGSLPGWAVDILAESWHVSAIFEGNKHVRATLDRCLKELRAAQARANKRQPEENIQVSRTAGK